jgi:hypothetical protein
MFNPTEPSADARQAAKASWQLYTAFIAEGFTAEQALELLGKMLSSASSGT